MKTRFYCIVLVAFILVLGAISYIDSRGGEKQSDTLVVHLQDRYIGLPCIVRYDAHNVSGYNMVIHDITYDASQAQVLPGSTNGDLWNRYQRFSFTDDRMAVKAVAKMPFVVKADQVVSCFAEIGNQLSLDTCARFHLFKESTSNDGFTTKVYDAPIKELAQGDQSLNPYMEKVRKNYRFGIVNEWMRADINYGKLRPTLSKEAKEAVAVYGFLNAISKAGNTTAAPLHYLEDVPPLQVPLANVLRYEIAWLERNEKEMKRLKELVLKECPGLFWEFDRIPKGEGMIRMALRFHRPAR